MTAVVGKYAARKVLGSQMKKYQDRKPDGEYDPYFTYTTNPRTGRKKKVKKQVAEYIPEHDAIILAKMRKRSYALDCSLFSIFGQRFGWSSVIGIVPAFGDAADAILATGLALRCNKVECKGEGLGKDALFRMGINIAIDFIIGLIPFLGDILDAGFKANTRNVRILEKRLDEVYKPVEMKGNDMPPATVFEDFSDEEDDRRAVMNDPSLDPRRPDPARTRGSERPARRESERQPKRESGRGWLGGSKRERRPDVEMGDVRR